MKTLENVQAATLTELAAFYNLHNPEAQIKKFADRKSAERRVMAIVESLAIIEAQGGDQETGALVEPKEEAPAPAPVVHKTRASRQVNAGAEFVSPNADVPEDEITPEMAAAELELMKAHAANAKSAPKAASGLSLSASIALTWLDPNVAAARMTRDGVTVDLQGENEGEWLTCGEDGGYKSVAAAFASLKLPMSKHIRFRLKLKKEGAAIFEWAGETYRFQLGRI